MPTSIAAALAFLLLLHLRHRVTVRIPCTSRCACLWWARHREPEAASASTKQWVIEGQILPFQPAENINILLWMLWLWVRTVFLWEMLWPWKVCGANNVNGAANGECALKKREDEGNKRQGQNFCAMASGHTRSPWYAPLRIPTHSVAPSSHYREFHSLVSYFSADVRKYPNTCSWRKEEFTLAHNSRCSFSKLDYQKLGATGHIASVAREESNESMFLLGFISMILWYRILAMVSWYIHWSSQINAWVILMLDEVSYPVILAPYYFITDNLSQPVYIL